MGKSAPLEDSLSSFLLFFFFFLTRAEGPWEHSVVDAVCVMVLCTGFLCRPRNAQPACEIHCMAIAYCSVLGFYPTSLHYYYSKELPFSGLVSCTNSYDTPQLPVPVVCRHIKLGWVRFLFQLGVAHIEQHWLSKWQIDRGCVWVKWVSYLACMCHSRPPLKIPH